MKIVRGLFSERTLADILSYVDEFCAVMPTPHDSTFGRKSAHNPPGLVAVHRQMAEFASDLFGEVLKPSYVYLSMYEKGGRCPLHIDRDQCYRTIDVLLRSEMVRPWRLRIGEPIDDEQRASILANDAAFPTGAAIDERIDIEKWTDAMLAENDAACYSGTHQWHYRPEPAVGRADLAFFHFVREDYCGPLD